MKQSVPQVLWAHCLNQRVNHKIHAREEECDQVLERNQRPLSHGEEVQCQVEEGGLRARHDERCKVAYGRYHVSLVTTPRHHLYVPLNVHVGLRLQDQLLDEYGCVGWGTIQILRLQVFGVLETPPTGWHIMLVKTSCLLRFGMFDHPVWAVSSCSSGPSAAKTAGTKSTGGFYQRDGSPCRSRYHSHNHQQQVSNLMQTSYVNGP